MGEPAYFRALDIVVGNFHLRDDGIVLNLAEHFKQMYKEFTGKDYEAWEVSFVDPVTCESGEPFRSGRAELESLRYSDGVCVPLPFKSYADMNATELCDPNYSSSGALIFYEEQSIPMRTLFVRGHEEGHALAIAGRTHLLEQKLAEKGRHLSFFWDIERSDGEGGREMYADIAGLYALERAGYDISKITPEELGVRSDEVEFFRFTLSRYLSGDYRVEPLPENACQVLNGELSRRLEVMEELNPSLSEEQAISFFSDFEVIGRSCLTNAWSAPLEVLK